MVNKTMLNTSVPFWRLLGALALACSLGATPALAQDDDDDLGLDDEDEDVGGDDEGGGEGGEETAASDSAGSDSAASASDSGDTPASGKGEAAGGDFTDVQTTYVIQGRSRLIGRTFEIAPQFLQSVNDRFISHTGLMLSGLYNIKENIAFEASVAAFAWWDDPQQFLAAPGLATGPRFGGRDTDTTAELNNRERLRPELVKLYRLTWLTMGDFQWSPIYGKVSVHDLILGQFSVYLSVGAGFAGLTNELAEDLPNPLDIVADPLGLELGAVQLTTSIGGGLRFYFLDWLGIRFEIRDYVQPLALLASQSDEAISSTFEVRNTLLVQMGVSFVIPAPWK
jgi:outer membrane beta-barrel protein